MPRSARGLAAVCCAGAAMLAVAACGASSPSGSRSGDAARYAREAPGAILSDALKVTRSATAFNLAGTLREDGTSIRATLGYRAPSSLSAQITEGTNAIKLIVVPAGSYLYANPAFWKQQVSGVSARELSMLANHWFRTSASMSRGFTSAFAQLTPPKIASCLSATFTAPRVTGTQTIDGQSAVVLHSAGASGAPPSNLYVATSAPHHLLRLSETGTAVKGARSSCGGGSTGGSNESLTFSNWNDVTINVPPGAKPLP